MLYRYLAVLDDRHDVKDPVTVIRVVEGGGPATVRQLNDDCVWARTKLLERIEAGEVPYRVRWIGPRRAVRIRRRRERKIAFRYSILVRDDDPTDQPRGVLREWESAGGWTYAETFGPEGDWDHSNVRLDIERGSDISTRIVPSDAPTVHRFIESLRRR